MPQNFAPPNGSPQAAQYQPQQAAQSQDNFEQNTGGRPMSPIAPPQAAPPVWPTYQQAAPQQPAYQPQQAQQPAYQAPPAPAAQPQYPTWQPQQSLPPDPSLRAGQPYNFNDGLRLAGPAGGGVGVMPTASSNAAAQGNTPALAAVPNTPQQYQQQAPPSTMLRDQLRQQGLPVSQYASDAELLADIGGAYGEVQAFRTQQQYGYQNNGAQGVSSGEDLNGQTPGQVNGQAAQTVTPGAPLPKRVAPEWRDEWKSMVREDENGMYVPASIAINPVIAQRANEYAAWQRERSQKLLRDPVSFVREEGLESYLNDQKAAWKQEIVNEFRQQEQHQQSQSAVAQFTERHKAQLFQLDQQGNPMRDFRGDYVRTQLGEQVNQQAAQIRQQFQQWYGHEPRPEHVLAEIQKQLPQQQQQAPPQQQPVQYQVAQPQQQQFAPQQFQQPAPAYYQQPQLPSRNEQMKESLIQRSIAMGAERYAPNQGGTIASAAASATVPQNSRLSFEQMLKQSAIEKGLMQPAGSY